MLLDALGFMCHNLSAIRYNFLLLCFRENPEMFLPKCPNVLILHVRDSEANSALVVMDSCSVQWPRSNIHLAFRRETALKILDTPAFRASKVPRLRLASAPERYGSTLKSKLRGSKRGRP